MSRSWHVNKNTCVTLIDFLFISCSYSCSSVVYSSVPLVHVYVTLNSKIWVWSLHKEKKIAIWTREEALNVAHLWRCYFQSSTIARREYIRFFKAFSLSVQEDCPLRRVLMLEWCYVEHIASVADADRLGLSQARQWDRVRRTSSRRKSGREKKRVENVWKVISLTRLNNLIEMGRLSFKG